MGWSGVFVESMNRETIEAIINGLFVERYKVVAYAIREMPYMTESVAYMAVKDKQTGAVFASVMRYLYGIRDKELVYKVEGEDVFPVVEDCPKEILDMLTPTEDKTAQAWREACRKHLKGA